MHIYVPHTDQMSSRVGLKMKKTVLVVDDEESYREMVVLMLKSAGFETIESDSGMNAFEIAKATMPDLIISDVMMYSGSGFMLREFLKRDEKTSRLPIILMSGHARDAGAWGSDPEVEYLAKPFTTEDLLSAVEKMLKLKKS